MERRAAKITTPRTQTIAVHGGDRPKYATRTTMLPVEDNVGHDPNFKAKSARTSTPGVDRDNPTADMQRQRGRVKETKPS
jgi:hypothetical protein